MKKSLGADDLTAIQLLAADAITAGEQAGEARGLGAHREAAELEKDRRWAIARIYKILGVKLPTQSRAGKL
jgi:hypothetical protein